jgi:replicative superfamily II helicase
VNVACHRGLLKIVFATGTLAAGINMPARTTVISALGRMTDDGPKLLPHNELLQVGTCYILFCCFVFAPGMAAAWPLM